MILHLGTSYASCHSILSGNYFTAIKFEPNLVQTHVMSVLMRNLKNNNTGIEKNKSWLASIKDNASVSQHLYSHQGNAQVHLRWQSIFFYLLWWFFFNFWRTSVFFWPLGSGQISSGFQSKDGSPQLHTCAWRIYLIHLRCNTCQTLGGQHGCWATFSSKVMDAC